MDALTALPGVGRKTANVVLGHALGVPGLPVDRHVLRVANRIGIAEGDDPEVVERSCARRCRRSAGRGLRHAHPARPPHLQAEAALRAVRRARRLRLPRRARARAGTRAAARPTRRRREDAGEARGPRRRSNASSLRRSATIPRRFREAMQNIAIVVEDEPSRELLREMEIEPPDTLFGLYQGTPLTERALGLRQRAARPHPALPGAARARGRGRRRPRSSRSARRSSTRSATTSA